VPNDIGVGKIRNFHPISRRISETVQDRTESYYTNDYFLFSFAAAWRNKDV